MIHPWGAVELDQKKPPAVEDDQQQINVSGETAETETCDHGYDPYCASTICLEFVIAFESGYKACYNAGEHFLENLFNAAVCETYLVVERWALYGQILTR